MKTPDQLAEEAWKQITDYADNREDAIGDLAGDTNCIRFINDAINSALAVEWETAARDVANATQEIIRLSEQLAAERELVGNSSRIQYELREQLAAEREARQQPKTRNGVPAGLNQPKPTTVITNTKAYEDGTITMNPIQPVRTFSVRVYADGWNGQFTLPETYLKELASYLSERASKSRAAHGSEPTLPPESVPPEPKSGQPESPESHSSSHNPKGGSPDEDPSK